MKKVVSIILALVMVLALAACGNTGTTNQTEAPTQAAQPEETTAAAVTETNAAEETTSPEAQETEPETEKEVELKPYKIAVAFTQINATALAQQEYLKNFIGPAFNVEFMFSEAIDSSETAMTFIENAYAANCNAIMNFQNSSVEQINAKANEVGMYIISNAMIVENSDLPFVVGYARAPIPSVAEGYTKMVEEFTSDNKDHNVVIISAGSGLGNAQHYECTYAILDALQKKYNLTYSDTLENLASSREMIQVQTGTDMKILIYPGYPNSDTYVSGLSAELQSGDYDLVLGCNQATTKFAVAIDEVEKAYNFDVKVGYFTSIDDAATAAATTKDSFGNASIDAFIINPGNVLVGTMFAALYNAMSGHDDIMRVNGMGTEYYYPIWFAPDSETYLGLSVLNKDEKTLEMGIDDIKDLLYIYHEDMTAEKFQQKLDSLTAEGVLAAVEARK